MMGMPSSFNLSAHFFILSLPILFHALIHFFLCVIMYVIETKCCEHLVSTIGLDGLFPSKSHRTKTHLWPQPLGGFLLSLVVVIIDVC